MTAPFATSHDTTFRERFGVAWWKVVPFGCTMGVYMTFEVVDMSGWTIPQRIGGIVLGTLTLAAVTIAAICIWRLARIAWARLPEPDFVRERRRELRRTGWVDSEHLNL